MSESMEAQVRRLIDQARFGSNAGLKSAAGEQPTVDDALTLMQEMLLLLMGLVVDLAREIDNLAEHTGYDPPPWTPRPREG